MIGSDSDLDRGSRRRLHPNHHLVASLGQPPPTTAANIHHQQQQQQDIKNKKLFPQKLWDLINDQRYSFCLRWSDDGQLVYLNRDQFEDSYLRTPDNQFHTQKAISFVRQMNMYGFKKVDDCFYENDNFKRDCEYLLKNMARKHTNKSPPLDGSPTNNNLLPGLSTFRAQNEPQSSSSPNSLLDATLSQSPSPLSIITQRQHNLNLLQNRHATLPPFSPKTAALVENHHLNGSIQPGVVAPGPTTGQMSELLRDRHSHHLRYTLNNNSTSTLNAILTEGTSSNRKNQNLINNMDMVNERDRSCNEDSLSSSNIDYCCEPPSPQVGASNLALTSNAIDTLTNRNFAQNDNYFNIFYAILSSLSGDMYLNNAGQPAQDLTSTQSAPKRRETANKATRTFKRSADSILDSKNNNNINYGTNSMGSNEFTASPSNKRAKVDSPLVDKRDTINVPDLESNNNSTTSAAHHAKNLVMHIAKIKTAIIDDVVTNEVAKHALRFVETLFDTAQVIARHSNNHAQVPEQKSMAQHDKFIGREDGNHFNGDLRSDPSIINLSDLNSALKLLPSKLSRLVE